MTTEELTLDQRISAHLDELDKRSFPFSSVVTWHNDITAMTDDASGWLWGMVLMYGAHPSEEQLRGVLDRRQHGLMVKFMMDADEMLYLGDVAKSGPGVFNDSAPQRRTVTFPAKGPRVPIHQRSPEVILAAMNEVLFSIGRDVEVLSSTMSLSESDAFFRYPLVVRICVTPWVYSRLMTTYGADGQSLMEQLLSQNAMTRWAPKKFKVEIAARKFLSGEMDGPARIVVLLPALIEFPCLFPRRDRSTFNEEEEAMASRFGEHHFLQSALYVARLGAPRDRFEQCQGWRYLDGF